MRVTSDQNYQVRITVRHQCDHDTERVVAAFVDGVLQPVESMRKLTQEGAALDVLAHQDDAVQLARAQTRDYWEKRLCRDCWDGTGGRDAD